MKTYLFVGASSAIANETFRVLTEKGATIIAISTKENSFGYDTFYKVEGYQSNLLPELDITIDGIVYFPGTINLKPFHRLKPEEFQHDFEVNALGAVHVIQKYLINLKKAPSSSVVLISSVAVQLGLPFHASIAMAKGAIEGLTKSLAAEFAPSIRVNCIAPSLVDTPLGEKFLSTPEKIEAMQKRNPMQKIGEPLEIAKAVSYLLTEDSSWVTGQVLSVDGGMGTLKNTQS